MKSQSRMWSVIEFSDGIQLVPSNWINRNTGMCFWPPFTSQSRTNKSIKEKALPDESWPVHAVVRIFSNAETYESGMKKLKLAEHQSELDTEDEETSKKKRKEKARRKYDDTTEEDEILLTNPIKDVPLPKPGTSIAKKLDFNYSQPLIECSSNNIERHPEKNEDQLLYIDLENISPTNYIILDESQNKNVSQLNETPITKLKTMKSLTTPRKHQKSSSPKKIRPESEFQRTVLKKLNTIIYEVRALDHRLSKLEQVVNLNNGKESAVSYAENLFETEDTFPLKSEEEVEMIEENLKNRDFFLKCVNSLKMLGGVDTNQTVINIMKTMLSNAVAEKFSFMGAKSKKSFKRLVLFKVVLASVRARHSEITETEVGELIAKWLVGAKLRSTREEQKKNKYSTHDGTMG